MPRSKNNCLMMGGHVLKGHLKFWSQHFFISECRFFCVVKSALPKRVDENLWLIFRVVSHLEFTQRLFPKVNGPCSKRRVERTFHPHLHGCDRSTTDRVTGSVVKFPSGKLSWYPSPSCLVSFTDLLLYNRLFCSLHNYVDFVLVSAVLYFFEYCFFLLLTFL